MNKTKPKIVPEKHAAKTDEARPAMPFGRAVKTSVSTPWFTDIYFISLLIIIIIITIIRFRLRTMPLERDEGEYAYIGQMILKGIAPFKSAYSMKLPGTALMYSILMLLFGQTSAGIHDGLMLINAATILFFYLGFKKLYNSFIALNAAGIYGFMSLSEVFLGFAAHATQFICFYVSIAFLLLMNYRQMVKTQRIASLQLFFIGLLLGMAFLMKQQAIFFILFGCLAPFFMVKEEKKGYPVLPIAIGILKKLFFYSAGVIIPYLLLLVIVWITGQFATFWLWTFKYASKYEGIITFHDALIYFLRTFLPSWNKFWFIWLLALAGLILLYKEKFSGSQRKITLLFLLCAIGAWCPGFYFRPHYFILLLPVLGLLAGITTEYLAMQLAKVLKTKVRTLIALVFFSLIIAVFVLVNNSYYFYTSTEQLCVMVYEGEVAGNPFNEAIQIAKYIKANTKDSDKIAVIGSEPEIYFYTNRQAATGYLYIFPLIEKQPYNLVMQNQMIEEMEKNKPAFIIYCTVAGGWLHDPGIPTKIFDWGYDYGHKYYTPVGFVDLSLEEEKWIFYWDDEIKSRKGKPGATIIILKRNAGE